MRDKRGVCGGENIRDDVKAETKAPGEGNSGDLGPEGEREGGPAGRGKERGD